MSHLTKEEQETIINFNAAESTASIYTCQRRIITKLRKNPKAKEIESGFYGSTEYAKFEMPQRLISFRSGKVSVSDDGETDADGETQRPAGGELGCPYCPKTFASKQGRKNHILKNHPDQEVPA